MIGFMTLGGSIILMLTTIIFLTRIQWLSVACGRFVPILQPPHRYFIWKTNGFDCGYHRYRRLCLNFAANLRSPFWHRHGSLSLMLQALGQYLFYLISARSAYNVYFSCAWIRTTLNLYRCLIVPASSILSACLLPFRL